MGSGPPEQSRATSLSRVSSPSAANMGAASAMRVAFVLRGDIALDVLDLRGPPLIVHAEGFGAAPWRDAVEARLDHRELGATRDLCQPKLDQRRRLVRI